METDLIVSDEMPLNEDALLAAYMDIFRGCLIGGAVGDALGYPVEFLDYDFIRKSFGEKGITKYVMDPIEGKALFSDDTQMTLFTANALLYGFTQLKMTGTCEPVEKYIYYAYLDWFSTQSGRASEKPISWLLGVEELYSNRAPGNTCLNALASGYMGTLDDPINTSKGCGGIMRVAPIALYFNQSGDEPEKILTLAAKAAAVTHGHPLGYMPAAAYAFILNRIVYGGCTVGDTLVDIIDECEDMLGKVFVGTEHLDELFDIMDLAVTLSQNASSDYDNISAIGGGWVGEEALAIAIYCLMRYTNDFDKAVIAAVNHDGDCDTTGALTGQLVGAIVGYSEIADKWKKPLELKDIILEIADDLCCDCPMSGDSDACDDDWIRKYIDVSVKSGQPDISL